MRTGVEPVLGQCFVRDSCVCRCALVCGRLCLFSVFARGVFWGGICVFCVPTAIVICLSSYFASSFMLFLFLFLLLVLLFLLLLLPLRAMICAHSMYG